MDIHYGSAEESGELQSPNGAADLADSGTVALPYHRKPPSARPNCGFIDQESRSIIGEEEKDEETQEQSEQSRP